MTASGKPTTAGKADARERSPAYRLVGINDDAVPAIAQMGHCTPSRFSSGSMALAADGTWYMAII